LPGLTVNAHRFPAPFGAAGVLGFVNNGDLVRAADRSAAVGSQAAAGSPAGGNAAIPGVLADTPGHAAAGPADPAYRRHDEQPAGVPGTAAQQAFISLVAPGALATQQRYGIPAAVTIAQAIDESGWGRSVLATADHNLFGIKGAGPAGRDMLPTREHENGVWVTRTAPFRVYHNVAESIEDHGRLLATDPAYRHAMASRGRPDAFATALTGVYATDPGYGSNLIALMRLYNLYRYDAATTPTASSPDAPAAPPAGVSAEPRVAGQQAVVPGIPHAAGSAGRDGIPGVAGALAVGAVRARIAPRGPLPTTRRYVPRIPYPVAADFVATAKGPLTRAQPLYADVAGQTGIGWELLAACDWMQCQARSRYSPVHGEKLGTVNPDGTVFRTRSAALAQCASELIELAGAVYL